MIAFGTKAETLKRLENNLHTARVLPQVSFCVREWREQPEMIYHRITGQFGSAKLIIRSSAMDEDALSSSNAGRYDSICGAKGKQNIFEAVNKVIASYQTEDDRNQVLVQPVLSDIKVSGVAFTMEPSTLGNYYVINYDDITGSTSSVTSGNLRNGKLVYEFKGGGKETYKNKVIEKICCCLRELEKVFESSRLDVEFALNKAEEMYIFQVRPLCVEEAVLTTGQQAGILSQISGRIRRENQRKPFLYGDKTIYGVMPDWNPAEIIGIRPRPLALSLYKEIITDNIWAYQRDNYGYCNMRSFPLLIDFFGLPYIDVRVSFNSFIPKHLKKELGEKLVNYYLDQLEQRPDYHDKIEFEIAFTCYTLDLPERIQCLREHGFSQEEVEEITDSLREMTKIIIDNEDGLWKKDYRKIEYLEKRYDEVCGSSMDRVSKIYWLLEDCKRYGTLPFAGLARAGFIAVQLLKSLIAKGLITEEEYQWFMSDLNTVSSIMKKDKKRLTREEFFKKYGHLRPGTYDICSKRYDEAKDIYFDWTNEWDYETEADEKEYREVFKLSLAQIGRLKEALKEHGMAMDVLDFFHFIRTAIEGREYAKFVFTKSLSEAIRLFGEIGKENNISIDDCAYSDIEIIRKMYASSMSCDKLLRKSIAEGKEKYRITKSLVLPALIFEPEDVYSFFVMDNQPNFITLKEAFGEVCELDFQQEGYDIEDKIVMIQSADPGYDWIFSRKIKGFITKFGGANSHMAIRANELSIPAVIGVGEKLYERLKSAKIVEIDSAARKVGIMQ